MKLLKISLHKTAVSKNQINPMLATHNYLEEKDAKMALLLRHHIFYSQLVNPCNKRGGVEIEMKFKTVQIL